MKIYYLLAPLLASFTVTASPMAGGGLDISGAKPAAAPAPPPAPPAPAPAPDPPSAPTPLPPDQDGVLPDGSVINYTPESCWTPPLSRPAPSVPYVGGICSVCALQRSAPDGSADYQLWARDNANNAMGNMPAATVFPDDGGADGSNNQSIVQMGGSPLTLWAMQDTNPKYSDVMLEWETPGKPQMWFDPAPGAGPGTNCTSAGTATNGAVTYFTCNFHC